jgi:hypothetical protein
VNGEARLETVLFQETHMLQIVVTVPSRGIQDLIGAVEIDELTTLADLRNLIAAQLPPQYVPTSYQFLFKGHACSEQQEAARKAVQALPRIQLNAQNPAVARPATSTHAANQQLSSSTPTTEWVEQTGRNRARTTVTMLASTMPQLWQNLSLTNVSLQHTSHLSAKYQPAVRAIGIIECG